MKNLLTLCILIVCAGCNYPDFSKHGEITEISLREDNSAIFYIKYNNYHASRIIAPKDTAKIGDFIYIDSEGKLIVTNTVSGLD